MGLSETILAAIIGALATMATAIVQLIRNRAPSESRPKKNRMRSLVATIALMIGCIVGGYAWSSLRAVSAKEELRATMKAEFAEQFAALVARKEEADARIANDADGGAFRALHGEDGSAESLVHLPTCRLDANPEEVGPVTCTERVAQSVALCAAVPAASQTTNLRVFARVPLSESAWQERDAGALTLGSLRIAESPVEYPVSAHQRAVCLDVANWSVDDKLAVRLVVDYETANKPAVELTAAAPGAASL
jgi:hypothetical protein